MSEINKRTFRINANINSDLNDWLDNESARTGHSKTTLLILALENYKQQKSAVAQLTDLSQLVKKMEQLSEKLEQN